MILAKDKDEFIGQIIDIFEDFLQERNIDIPCDYPPDEVDGETNAAIYGSNYDEIAEALRDMMQSWDVL